MTRAILSLMMSAWFALSPALAHAQSAQEAVPFESLKKRLMAPPEMRFKPEYVEVTARDQNNRETTFQIAKFPEQEVRKFSPKRLAADFAAKMKEPRFFENIKATTKRFPMESSLFFIAIGAVTAYQIATDYSGNPMRMAQHVEHSLSPLGMFSFYMFMATNGVASSAMQSWIKNPRFHHLIPYLGMSAGYFVQSTISSFAADPNVKACVKQGLGGDISKMEGIEKDPCEAAFSYYAVKSKFYEMTPGLISMLGSTFLTWAAERATVSLVLKITGVDIALFITPMGPGVSALRLAVTNAIKMGLFYYIDVVFLNHFVTYNFKNIFDGRYIAKLDAELARRLAAKKASGWADQLPPMLCEMTKTGKDCERDLAATLKETQSQLSNWRMMNLQKIYEAHMGWQDMLAGINSGYDLSYGFYKELIEEVRNSKWKLTAPQRLDRVDPLYGVTAKELPEEKSFMYHLKPHFTENMASETARDAAAWIQSRLDDGTYAKMHLHPGILKILQDMATRLSSADVNVQGSGVALLNKTYHDGMTNGLLGQIQPELREISKILGPGAEPLMNPGQAFFATYGRWSEAAEAVQKSRLRRASGVFLTQKPAEYMGLQAICGPDVDKNEAVIAVAFGGGAQFIPPRVTSTSPQICHGMGEYGAQSSPAMYKIPIQEGSKTYAGFVDYLKGQIRPDILGDQNNSGFLPWWEKKVEPQVHAKYREMGLEYEKIVASLVTQLHDDRDAKANMGPAANGVIESIRQQMRLDLLILGEVLKDLYVLQQRKALPAPYFNSSPEPVPRSFVSKANLVAGSRSSLLRALREGGSVDKVRNPSIYQTSVLEFSRLAPLVLTEDEALKVGRSLGYALQIQKEVEYEFENLVRMLRRIRVVEIEGRARISSNLENADLAAQVEKVGEKLQSFAKLLGVSEAEENRAVFKQKGELADGALVQMPTQEVRDVVMNALEDLAALTNEVQMYGSIANAVSWEKIRNLEKNSQMEEFQNETQKKARQLGQSMTRFGAGAH